MPIIIALLTSIWNIFSKSIDKVFDMFKVMVPIVWSFLTKTKSLLWFIVIWTFFFGLTSTLLSFTLYHISVSLQYFLAIFTTEFTVSIIVKSIIAMFIFSIWFFFKKLI